MKKNKNLNSLNSYYGKSFLAGISIYFSLAIALSFSQALQAFNSLNLTFFLIGEERSLPLFFIIQFLAIGLIFGVFYALEFILANFGFEGFKVTEYKTKKRLISVGAFILGFLLMLLLTTMVQSTIL